MQFDLLWFADLLLVDVSVIIHNIYIYISCYAVNCLFIVFFHSKDISQQNHQSSFVSSFPLLSKEEEVLWGHVVFIGDFVQVARMASWTMKPKMNKTNLSITNINKRKANTKLKISQAKTGWRKIKSSFKPADSLRWQNKRAMKNTSFVLSRGWWVQNPATCFVSKCSNYLKFKRQDIWYLMRLGLNLPAGSVQK